MRGQDIYSSQEETTSFPSSCGSADFEPLAKPIIWLSEPSAKRSSSWLSAKKILEVDELRSLKLWKEKQERKEKGKK